MKSILIHLILLCFFAGLFPVVAQVQHQIDFEKNFHIDTTVANGEIYQYIQAPGLNYRIHAGKPLLPIRHITLLLPKGAIATGVSLQESKAQRILLTHPLYPGQPLVPTSIQMEDIIFTHPLKEIYESNAPYPQNRVQIGNTVNYGDNRIVSIEVSPFQYFPKTNELYFSPSLDFTVEYSLPKATPKKSGIQCSNESLKMIIDNPKYIEIFADKTEYTTMAGETFGIGLNCDYVIVTPQYLIPAFAELMAWKKQKGVNIKIMSIETIKAYYTKDLISNISDDAGKLRQFIIDTYKNSNSDRTTKPLFVLLAGDHTMVPIRYGRMEENDDTPDNIIPTDSYYGDITSNWDVDRDGRYGEASDNGMYIILQPHIGRLLAINAEEVKNWTRKLIKYESNPGNGDYSYLTRALFSQADQLQELREANKMENNRFGWWTSSTILEEANGNYNSPQRPTFPTGKNIIDEFNKKYGVCSFMGHGSPNNVAVATKGLNADGGILTRYGITSLDEYVLPESYVNENGNGFDNMTNYNYPTIYHSTSCLTMPFDYYKRTSNIRNMGEAYTVLSKGGGPAYLGNTRNAHMSSSLSDPNPTDFFEGTSNYFFTQIMKYARYYPIGMAFSMAKYLVNYDFYSYNLLGCPEMNIWTTIPRKFTNATTVGNPNSISVYTGGIFATICMKSMLNDNYFVVQKNQTGYTFQNIPANSEYIITITKSPDFIPYIIRPVNVYIQNQNLNEDCFVQANNAIYVGSSVTTSKTQGPVTIGNGTYSTGVVLKAPEVILQKDVEIKKGMVFCIEPSDW